MATSYTFRPIITSGLILSLDAENTKSYVSGSNWYDLTSNNNNGVLTNGPTFEFNGVASFIFNGVDNYVVTDNIYGPTEFTICVWCKVDYDGSDDYGRIVEKGFNSEWSVTVNKGLFNDKFNFQYFDNANIVISNTSIDPSKYQYVVCTIQDNGGGNKTGTIYVDGVFDNSGTRNATLAGQNAPITIGGQMNELSIASLKGNISVVQYYGRVLTPSEVLQNYNALKHRFDIPTTIVTDGLILNLDAGNPTSYPGSGTNWNDLSTYNNDGTLINLPTFNSSNSGSLVFDGVNDYGRIPYNSDFNLSSTDYTLEGWFNSNSFSSGQILISKDTTGANFDWCLYMSNSTNISIYSNGTTTNVTATVPTMNTGQWYQFVVTCISGVIRIYLNSVLYQTGTMSTSNASQFYISLGCAGWNIPNSFFNGKISILRVYRIGLTGSEVLQNYNAIKNRY